MISRSPARWALLALMTACAATAASDGTLRAQNADLGVFVSPRGTQLKMLVMQATLGGAEVEVGEMTFPAGSDSGDHTHNVAEIFYVLSGELEHIVNGKPQVLKAGMIGSVHPPDTVRHRVSASTPARALVIWAPAGEASRITGAWKRVDTK